jgi:hypothetical protein
MEEILLWRMLSIMLWSRLRQFPMRRLPPRVAGVRVWNPGASGVLAEFGGPQRGMAQVPNEESDSVRAAWRMMNWVRRVGAS